MPRVNNGHRDVIGKLFVCISILLFLFVAIRTMALRLKPIHGPIAGMASLLPIYPMSIDGLGRISYGRIVKLAHVYEQLDVENAFDYARYFLAVGELSMGLSNELDIVIDESDVDAWISNQPDSDVSQRQLEYIAHLHLELNAIEDKARREGLYQDDEWSRVMGIQSFLDLGISFADLARQYSEFETSASGGYIGYVEKNDIDEVYWELFETEDEISVVESDQAYIIARISDRILDADDEVSKIELSVIGIYKSGIEGMLESYAKEHAVRFN